MSRSRPPTLRALTRKLRAVNEAIDGPWTVALAYDSDRWQSQPPRPDDGWGLESPDYPYAVCGHEDIPGDGLPFDAVAAARRLLAALRDTHQDPSR